MHGTTKKQRDHRKYRLRRLYGLTPEAWDGMLEAQGGCCAICQSVEHGHTNWHTDHCHKTGFVRGILCRSCNGMLGLARDDTCILENAIEYLNHPRWR